MLYLDTSLLITAVLKEAETARIQLWLAQQEDDVVISDWSVVEFASGIARKQNAKEIAPEDRIAALTWMRQLSGETTGLLTVSRDAMRRAADAINTGVRVRGADALHLAVAEEYSATLCTLDKEQAVAGQAMAIRTRLI